MGHSSKRGQTAAITSEEVDLLTEVVRTSLTAGLTDPAAAQIEVDRKSRRIGFSVYVPGVDFSEAERLGGVIKSLLALICARMMIDCSYSTIRLDSYSRLRA